MISAISGLFSVCSYPVRVSVSIRKRIGPLFSLISFQCSTPYFDLGSDTIVILIESLGVDLAGVLDESKT